MDKASISDPVDVLEQRILTSVMAKMPGSMEVESEAASSSNAKIHELEKSISKSCVQVKVNFIKWCVNKDNRRDSRSSNWQCKRPTSNMQFLIKQDA